MTHHSARLFGGSLEKKNLKLPSRDPEVFSLGINPRKIKSYKNLHLTIYGIAALGIFIYGKNLGVLWMEAPGHSYTTETYLAYKGKKY